MNYYNYFVTKKSLNNIPYKKFLTSSNNSQNNIHYYVIDLSTKKEMLRQGTHIFTKIKDAHGRKKKKNFSYFILEIPNFSYIDRGGSLSRTRKNEGQISVILREWTFLTLPNTAYQF